jgi:hypothetical protein
MPIITLKLSDDNTEHADGVRLEVAHDDFPTHDADGNELPVSPALRAAVALIEAYKMGPVALNLILDQAHAVIEDDLAGTTEG